MKSIVGYLFIFTMALSTSVFAQDKPVFEEDILPVLELNCLGCHGSNDPQAGLNMEGIAQLMIGGRSGKVILPGNSAESKLFLMITGQQQPMMPPEPLLPLEDSDIALIKTWIDSGTASVNPPVVKDKEPIEPTEIAKAEPDGEEKEEKEVKTSTADKTNEIVKPVTKHNDPFFQHVVSPIFEAKCAQCHSGEKPKAGLLISDLNCVMQSKFVTPSKPEESLIYTAIAGISKKQMPPKSQPQLSDAEKEIIRRWIVSLPQKPKTPREVVEKTVETIEETVEEIEETIEESIETITKPTVESEITFSKDILPIFETSCVGCHGGQNPQAGLTINDHEFLLSGKFVIPQKPDESSIYQVISGISEKQMPPKPLPPLEEEQVELIKQWIAQGAILGGEKPEIASGDMEEEKEIAAVMESQYADSQIGAVAFHPTKPLLAVGRLYEVQLFEYDLENSLLKQIAVFPKHSHLIRALEFSPEGTLLAAGGGRPALQGEIMLWDINTKELVSKIEGHRDNIYGISFSPDGKTIASSSYDRTIILWDVKSSEETAVLEDHVDSVYDVAFSPDGKLLASVAGDRTVKIWDVESGKRLYTLSESEKELYSVAFHPSGKYVAAGGVDRMIRVWELRESDGYLIQSKFAHDGAVLRVAYSPDGSILYSTSDDRSIKAWDTETYLEKTVFEEQSDWVYGLVLNQTGNLLAAGRYDGTFDIYDAAAGNNLNLNPQTKPKKVSMKQSANEESTSPPVEDESGAAFASTKSKENQDSDNQNSQTKKKKSVNDNPFEVGALEGTGTYPSFLSSLNPKVATYGDEIEFTLKGKNLAGLEIIPDNKNITVEIIEVIEEDVPEFVRSEFDTGKMIVDSGVPFTIKFKMNISEDVNPGIHRVRARTPLAMTNVQSFLIEKQSAINETEDNNDYLNAQTVELPNILAGRMNSMGDVDVFAFDAEAEEELTFEVIASTIGSGIDSRMSILNSEGEIIRESTEFEDGRDAKMGHRFESAGTYYLQITDSLLRGGGYYRIHVTKRPFIIKHDPFSVQKNTKTEIQIKGFNLNNISSVSVLVPEDHSGNEYTLPFKTDHGSPIEPIRLAVNQHITINEKEENKTQIVSVPVAINGRIYSKNSAADQDDYLFSAKKDQPLVIEVAAQRYGSPLDSKIEILHEDGSPVEIATVRSVAETYTVLADRDSRSGGMRLNSWNDFNINDYVMVGSEILKIEKLPDYPDEDVSFFTDPRRGWRIGFFGTTPSHHAVDTKVYKVDIHPPHSKFPPNGLPVHTLYAKNDDGSPSHGKDSYFRFVPPKDGNYIVRVSDAQSKNHPNNTYSLSIRHPRPDFKLFVNAGEINIPKGGKVPVSVTIDRYDGFDGEVMIDIPDLPQGYKCTLTHIPPTEGSSSFLIEALPGAQSTDPDARFTVDAYTKINGEWVKRSGSFGALTVTFDPDIKCSQEPKEVTLVPGGTAKITVKATRHNGFEDRIPIGVRNLPHGVYVLDTGLNGILIRPGETERTYTLYAEPWVKPQALTVFSTLEVETRSALPNIYATAPSVLNITNDPQAIAQNEDEFLQQKKKY